MYGQNVSSYKCVCGYIEMFNNLVKNITFIWMLWNRMFETMELHCGSVCNFGLKIMQLDNEVIMKAISEKL